MFREKYKRDMEKVSPDPESLRQTKEKMIEACEKKPRRLHAKPLIAAAVCLLLISGSVMFAFYKNSPGEANKNLENPYITRPDNESNPLSKSAQLTNEANYEDIYSKIKDLKVNSDRINVDAANEAVLYGNEKSAKATGGDANYSDTNNQVEGVQEADILKTDGKYIYACGSTVRHVYFYDNYPPNGTDATKGKVYILSADNGKLELASTIALRGEYKNTRYGLREMLLFENTLVLIKEGYAYADSDASDTGGGAKKSSYYYPRYDTLRTAVEIYDITDRAKPVFKNELYQSGMYSSSRMIGQYLYIITNHYVYSFEESNPSTYIPYCSSYDEEYLVPASCIYIPENVKSSQYTVITGIDVLKPENHRSSLATLGFAGTVYASDKNIYVASFDNTEYYSIWDGSVTRESASAASNTVSGSQWSETITDHTNICRFSIKDGVVGLAASAKISGNLINQFAMDEYNDAFRVAVTVNEYSVGYKKADDATTKKHFGTKRYNNLYILDLQLNITGSVTNLAPNETIQSVRFDGEIGYVVTFRRVDPLFAIDLSDVTAPKVLSALKIPGFSTYMHAYGDGLLFGIGFDADEFGRTNGIKMSMFDITDKTDVSEIAVYKLGSNSYYSEALYNHKAILVDSGKNLIGFPLNEYNPQENSYSSYKFFRYENNTFKELGSIPFQMKFDFVSLRGLYIGDYVYVFAQGRFINAYDINTFSLAGSFQFN